jgi:hypothetical protein
LQDSIILVSASRNLALLSTATCRLVGILGQRAPTREARRVHSPSLSFGISQRRTKPKTRARERTGTVLDGTLALKCLESNRRTTSDLLSTAFRSNCTSTSLYHHIRIAFSSLPNLIIFHGPKDTKFYSSITTSGFVSTGHLLCSSAILKSLDPSLPP